MTAKVPAQERVKRIETALPEAVELARAISLSVRAEPELVRALRLRLFPRSGAWIEADLYFSTIVAQRTPDWIVLDNEFAGTFRDDLTRQIRDSANVRRAFIRIRDTIKRAHAGVPFEIRQEEEILALAVEQRGGVRRTQAAIDQTLRPLFGRLLVSPDEAIGTARWFASAARRMPPIARETEAFALLAFAASSVLGGQLIDPAVKGTLDTFGELSRYLPASVKHIGLWIGLTTRGLQFAFAPTQGYQRVDVPASDPVLLEVRSGDAVPRLVSFPIGHSSFAPMPSGRVTIRTLSRDLFRLRPTATAEIPERITSEEYTGIPTDHDVFISSASRDAEWVQALHESLQRRLSELLGFPVSIFLDRSKLTVGDSWESTIVSAIRRSTVLLAVVSPSYIDSPWAMRELDIFESAARERSGGSDAGSLTRVVSAVALPPERPALPPQLTSAPTVNFFTRSDVDSPYQFGPQSAEFENGVNVLARTVAGVLRRIRAGLQQVHVMASGELKEYAERLDRELSSRGYPVVRSHEPAPRASTTVLLIGDMPLTDLERLLANTPAFSAEPIFIWLPQELDELRRRVIDELSYRGNVQLMFGVRFHHFLEEVIDSLRRPGRRERATPLPGSPTGTPTVYFICGPEDRESASVLEEYLRARSNIKLIIETPPGEQRHRRLDVDGVAIYWGAASRSRIEQMVQDSSTIGRPTVLFIGPPENRDKQRIQLPHGMTVFHVESLEFAARQIADTFGHTSGPDVRK